MKYIKASSFPRMNDPDLNRALEMIDRELAGIARTQREWTDVKLYGAIGDGHHDDTKAIQKAINSLTSGGTVYFPQGVYITTSRLDVPSNITLSGTKARIKYTGSGDRIIQNLDTVSGNENITIDKLEIEATVSDIGGGEMGSNAHSGIRMEKVDHLKIKDCIIEGCGYGVETQGVDAFDLEITGNHLTKCVTHGLAITGDNVRVTSNVVLEHGYDDGFNESVKEAIVVRYGGDAEGKNNVVSFNEVYTCVHTGIAVSKMIDVTVVGNTVDDAQYGMEIFNCQGITVVGNTIRAVDEYGILLNGDNPGHNGHPSERVTIVGNTINGCEVGIGGHDYKSFDISHNTIYNWTEVGILMSTVDVNANDIYAKTGVGTISDNKILDMNGSYATAKGIYVYGIGNVSIKDNIIKGMNAGSNAIEVLSLIDIWANRLENISIEGNKIKDCTCSHGIDVTQVHNLVLMENQFMGNTFGAGEYDLDQISGRFIHDRQYASIPTVLRGFSKGDIFYNDKSGADDCWGWIVHIDGDYNTGDTHGDITSGQTSLVVADDAGFYVTARIRVAGAGVASADLDTNITAIDNPSNTFTLADAAGTTVDDALVTYLDPVIRELRQQPTVFFESSTSRVQLRANTEVNTGVLDFNLDNNSIVIPETTGYFQITEYETGHNLFHVKATGEVTKLWQPAFFAYNSVSDLNVTGDGTQFTLDCNTELYDQAGNYANPTFTAPVTGKYFANYGIQLSNILAANANFIVWVSTSNRDYVPQYGDSYEMSKGTGGNMAISGTLLADMDANDTAIVRVTVQDGTKVVDIIGHANDPKTYFAMTLLC